MRRTVALLISASLAAAPLAGCGEEEPATAAEFCQDHGGVNVALNEPDGDATCNDGAEYEGYGDGEESSESSSKKKKKRR